MYDTDSFKDKIIAIQGIAGKVGSVLARDLAGQGAIIIGSGGVNQSAAQKIATEVGAKLVPPDEIYEQRCDVFAPCALGGVLNDNTIPKLKCRITAGGANNQLWDAFRHSQMLQDKGILHAPAFWINAGGVINVAHEFHPEGYSEERASADVKKIYDRGKTIFKIAREEKTPSYAVAVGLAQDRIQRARRTSCPSTSV